MTIAGGITRERPYSTTVISRNRMHLGPFNYADIWRTLIAYVLSSIMAPLHSVALKTKTFSVEFTIGMTTTLTHQPMTSLFLLSKV
jgi:hypothetical protein